MPWNEVSRRYVDEEPEFYLPQIRDRAVSAKQGSGDILIGADAEAAISEIQDSIEQGLKSYNNLLALEIAPEIARAALPQSMITEWFWSGTLGAYAEMLKLRLDPHTQYESRIVAEKIRDLVLPLYPVSLSALLENK